MMFIHHPLSNTIEWDIEILNRLFLIYFFLMSNKLKSKKEHRDFDELEIFAMSIHVERTVNVVLLDYYCLFYFKNE